MPRRQPEPLTCKECGTDIDDAVLHDGYCYGCYCWFVQPAKKEEAPECV